MLLGKQSREGLTDPFYGWRKQDLVSLRVSAGPTVQQKQGCSPSLKDPIVVHDLRPAPFTHTLFVSSAPHVHGQWTARVPGHLPTSSQSRG